MDGLEHRAPRPDEAEALLLQLAISFQGYKAFAPEGWEPPDELTPESVARLREALSDPRAYALMATHHGDPVAHVLWAPAHRDNDPRAPLVPGVAHLRQLFVLEPWWGTGVAATLHDRAVGAMRERGWRAGRLFTPAPHARARRFYERRGWELVRVADDDRFGMPVAEYRLELG